MTADEEHEYYDSLRLARLYDTSKSTIKRTVEDLRLKGYDIPVLKMGGMGKWKIHGRQFRKALMAEYELKGGREE